MIPIYTGLHRDPFLQKITGPITNTLWFPCTKDVFVILFFRRLLCDPVLQRFALRFSSTEDYIATPFYRGLHCDPLLPTITCTCQIRPITNTLWWPFTQDYVMIPFYKGIHCDPLLQRTAIRSNSRKLRKASRITTSGRTLPSSLGG